MREDGRFGLCDRCEHQRVVGNTRGSTFSLFRRSETDSRFPRYPPVPVRACVGFEPRAEPASGPQDTMPG